MSTDLHDLPTTASVVAAARLDTRASQVAFRVLLDALARPGLVQRLPEGVLGTEIPRALVLPLALADLDVGVAVTGGDDASYWRRIAMEAAGGRMRGSADADLVVALGRLSGPEVLALRRGRAEAPEEGARLAIGCRYLSDGPSSAEVRLELRGPGVPGRRLLAVDGVRPEVFAALAEANGTFPVGIDTWLVADDGAVVGLPRSTRIRIIERRATAGTKED